MLAYVNYKKWSVRYDLEGSTFGVRLDGMGEIIRDARVASMRSARGPQIELQDYASPVASYSRTEDSSSMSICYAANGADRQDITLSFTCSDAGVVIGVGGEGTMSTLLSGLIYWGDHDQSETMAVAIGRQGYDLRSAYGPAACSCDDALFDRDTDSALKFDTGGSFRLRFDWEARAFRFTADTLGQDYARSLHISVKHRVYEALYGNGYKKVNPNTTFKTPPVGWMSWYSVQFEAGEKSVMENARWQAEHLKDYGADTIWVDWEWYHRDFSSVGADDLDMYHPDPISYPNGLKAVADQIKELGFIPALWIGPTCDPRKNEMIEMYPEAVMIQKYEWCGQYFLDPSHPKFLDEMLVRTLRQSVDWGYKAVKWDCLPTTMALADRCNSTVYGAAEQLSTREIMLGAFKKAREFLGEDYYMLYCCAQTQRDIDLACQVFDAARIGGDIFRWPEFISQCVDKVYKYYAMHEVMLNNDPDNVVLREKFNTLRQAVTRACFVSLLGMPFTLGDNLPDLDEARVEILRRSIPPLKVRPMDVRTGISDGNNVKLNLCVERPDMRYNVLDVINLLERDNELTIDFARDAHLEPDAVYAVYDYWNREYLGELKRAFAVKLGAHESKVFAIHEVGDVPQVLSTSRHISQGAYEIVSVEYDASVKALKGVSNVVGGEAYEVVVHATDALMLFMEGNHTTTSDVRKLGKNVWRVSFHPDQTGEFAWEIGFEPAMRCI